MYRIKIQDIMITKRLTLDQAREVKEELLKHYFTGCSSDELVIIDENGNPVDDRKES